MQNATGDQRGLLKRWALAAIPAGSAGEGPSHPEDPITPVLLWDSQGSALPCSCTPGTPRAPRAPHHSAEHGEGSRAASQVLGLNHICSGEGFCPGICSTQRSTNAGTEAERAWRESSRAGHGTEPLRARAGPSLPGYREIFPPGLTYRTQSLNLKSESEEQTPRMESSDRGRTGPNNSCTFFRAHVTPVGEGAGEESAEQLQPLLAAAYLLSQRTRRETRSQMLNESTGGSVMLAVA